ncbi:MAG: hypothetical protein IJV85_01915 [Clostridia bacterium]|nr:hypothetical protein [Clostridia bacterium]
MISVYTDADYLASYKQKKRIVLTFWAVTACYVMFCGAWLAYHISLPYKHPMLFLPKLLIYVASAAYVLFAFPYLAIKYERIRRYYKMLHYVSVGLKQTEQNYFYCFAKQDLPKDHVDVVSCIFNTWNDKKKEWLERETYLDAEKPFPDFGNGDLVRYVTQSNFLIQYEIVERDAMEYEEDDE